MRCNDYILVFMIGLVYHVTADSQPQTYRQVFQRQSQVEGGNRMHLRHRRMIAGGDWLGRAGNLAKGIGGGVGRAVDTVGDWFKNVDTDKIASGVDTGIKVANFFMSRNQAKQAAEQYRADMQFKLEQLCDAICVTEWSSWTICTARCGGGVTYRTRQHSLPGRCKELGNFHCRHATNQTAHCNLQCPNGAVSKSGGGGCECPRGFSGQCCSNEVTCDYPGKPRHSKVDGTFPAKYGMVATYTCNPGWALVGQEQIICKANGKWDGQKPTCERIKCSMPAAPQNGRIINSQTEYRHSEEVVFLCEDGYTIRGPAKRQCIGYEGAEGRWTGFTPLCEPISCGDPDIPIHGERQGTNFRLGGKVEYRCLRGFRLMGSKKRTCLPSGRWSGHNPECQVITCEKPHISPHSHLLRTREVYRYGTRIMYECELGYNLEGSRVLICIVDTENLLISTGGKWNGSAPICKAAMCGNPGTPEYGAKDGSVYYFPNNVTFSCFAGHVLRGISQLHCQRDGTWSNQVPICEACPVNYYKSTLDSGVECSACPINTHTLTEASTSLQQCVCDKGYKGPSGGPCEEISCPVLEAPINGSITECGNKLDDSCDVSCVDGYILERGSSRRTCQESGAWTGSDPVCSACPKDTYKSDMRSCLPCPKHSHTKAEASMQTECVCDVGYHGNNGGQCDDVNECRSNDGLGPCQDTCENTDGSYRCGCSIPGHILDPNNRHICIVDKTCRNLTENDAPENGGLVCHWYREENSQQCGVRCNPGYEFPARVNNFEYCGSTTGYLWSHEERDEPIEPCIEEFFPEFRLEANSTYFVRACHQLTESEKNDVKRDFANLLTREGICKKRNTKVCDMHNVGIICGRTTRRRKRGVDEEVDEVDFTFDIKAFQPSQNPKDCDKICQFLRIPQRRCSSLCLKTYKRFLKAAVLYSKRQLTKIYGESESARFVSANRQFEPSNLETSDVIINCQDGMKSDGDVCVPCTAGTYYSSDDNECISCPRGTYQPEKQQKACLACPNGTVSTSPGSASCKVCPEGKYGKDCKETCNCLHGHCDPRSGQCHCNSGWEGARCDTDIPGCREDSCHMGVTCTDIPAPGTGLRCGLCPDGYTGNGAICSLKTATQILS